MTPFAASTGERAARRARRKRARERGVALVLVLGALTILTIMLTDFQDESSAQLGSALSARDQLRAEYAAKSGIELARLLIAAEPTIRKSLTLSPIGFMMGGTVPQIPVWSFADRVLGAFNDAAGVAKFAALTGTPVEKLEKLGMKGANFELTIIDEDSKLNVNAAARDPLTQTRLAASILGLIGAAQFEGMFSGRDGDGQFSDRQTVCGAVLDWVDADQNLSRCDITGASGPSTGGEDSFYQLLDPPYMRKNAPFDSLEELRMVRGISDDFWSTFVEPDNGDPRRRLITVWGAQGKVNINSANAQTLMAIICGNTTPPAKVCTDPMEAGKFLMLVNLVQSLMPGAPLFHSPKMFISTLKHGGQIGPMLKMFGLEPITFRSDDQVIKQITTESKVFSLVSIGYVKNGERSTRVRMRTVVDFRDAPTPQQLLDNLTNPGAAGSASAGLPGGAPTATATATMGLPFAGFVPGQIPSGMPSGMTPSGMPAFMMPDPAGRVIYFRQD
jgi:general secretion pathway protein K